MELFLLIGYFRMICGLMTTLDVEPEPPFGMKILKLARDTAGGEEQLPAAQHASRRAKKLSTPMIKPRSSLRINCMEEENTMTSRLDPQHVFSSALSAPAIRGAFDDAQTRSHSAVPKQPVPYRFQPKMVLVIACVLALMVSKVLPCSAQAEVDPDHYEMTNQQLIPPAHNRAIPNRNAGNFRGKVTLPFDVTYAGVTLPPGSYSLSVHSLGTVVTLTPVGKTVKVQAHVRSRSSATGPSAVVLERTGKRRTLAAIRLKEPGLTLDLKSEQRGNASADTELILISCATCTASGN